MATIFMSQFANATYPEYLACTHRCGLIHGRGTSLYYSCTSGCYMKERLSKAKETPESHGESKQADPAPQSAQ